MGREKSIELIKEIRLVNKRCLCFQDASFLTNLVMIDSQVSNLHGFVSMGIPKYTKGVDKLTQLRNFANFSTTSLATPKPPNLLF